MLCISSFIRRVAYKVVPTIYRMCDYVVLHDQEDHKYVFLPENKPPDLIPDKRGRKKGQPYIKNGQKIYDVVIDMYESTKFKDVTGDMADIWVGTKEEAENQLRQIKRGLGGGSHFIGLHPGGKKDLK
jgi:hypothetical protein